MNSSSRVILNTTIQYIRTIITTIVALYTTRLILSSLGENDYGIYALVGSVIGMLSFLKSSLATTTYRFLSYNQGKKDIELLKKVFNNSVITQWAISLFLVLILIALIPFLFNGFLNIPQNRTGAAISVYCFMLISLFFSMLSTPYLATLISHENILYASIVQIIDSLIKIPIALVVVWFPHDKLKLYAALNAGIEIINFLFYYIYSKIKYEETTNIKFKDFDKNLFKEIFSFAGWNIYSEICIIGRTQGVAIIINKFYGTAVNAAYGIGASVSGMTSFLSSSLQTAINPQLIRAEGSNDRFKMLRIAEISSKFSTLLLALLAFPLLIEMDSVLSLWLKDVPKYTNMFCTFIVLTALVDQLTIGCGTANMAIGNIKKYSLVINSIKFLTIPFSIMCLLLNLPLYSVMICYLLFEFVGAVLRLPFLKKTGNLMISDFFKRVFKPIFLPLLITLIACLLCSYFCKFEWGFLLTFIVSAITLPLSTYFLGLSNDEKIIINELLLKFLSIFKKNNNLIIRK
jgi:O-antigen/teichoic acid export membrane protein